MKKNVNVGEGEGFFLIDSESDDGDNDETEGLELASSSSGDHCWRIDQVDDHSDSSVVNFIQKILHLFVEGEFCCASV